MQLTDIITLLHPTANRLRDIILQDDGQGPYIKYWNEAKFGPQPTEQELLDQIPALQTEYDNMQVNIKRIAEYPNEHSLTIALWEAYVEGDHTALTALQEQRVAIKQKYPKV